MKAFSADPHFRAPPDLSRDSSDPAPPPLPTTSTAPLTGLIVYRTSRIDSTPDSAAPPDKKPCPDISAAPTRCDSRVPAAHKARSAAPPRGTDPAGTTPRTP